MLDEKGKIVTEESCKNFQWQLHKYFNKNKKQQEIEDNKTTVAVEVICKSFANHPSLEANVEKSHSCNSNLRTGSPYCAEKTFNYYW